MPALTAYAHAPAHGAGWPSMNSSNKPSLVPRTGSSCSQSALAPGASPPITARPRSTKSRFERLAKPLSSPASRLRKSKSTNSQLHQQQQQPVLLVTPSPPNAVRGILTKHSSLLNLSSRISTAVLERNPALALVIGQPSAPPPTSAQPVTKKVRFSGNLGDGGARAQERMGSSSSAPSGCGCARHCRGQTPTEGAEACRQLEPVIETIFLTYSRSAYDRSPIAVDRVFNKSLALPPRTEEDSDCGSGRWLADLLPVSAASPHTLLLPAGPVERGFPSELGSDQHLEAKILLPLATLEDPASADPLDAHHIYVATESPEAVDWPSRPEIFGHSWFSSEDARSESTASSSSSQEPNTPAIAALFPHAPLNALLAPIPVSVAPSDQACSLSVENLAHHAFENLSLNGSDLPFPPACVSLDADPLCGFGNWTRGQVFDSCDALDGF
ncbi:hypothetical protein PTTG_03687 [Puccinia triticina 1-1 BBBD Race 1]|uniref:Uncharacterized protein n=1 Tax=Puccinia triticina (isolate 1-1 / race 1 (BBBD)) TaxID=630390 RepID=A0A180GHP5_PUCT1|nr:hypothetical protein PTTG_03687 [Puccinia triticina 1-1 BBBD Race 1]